MSRLTLISVMTYYAWTPT